MEKNLENALELAGTLCLAFDWSFRGLELYNYDYQNVSEEAISLQLQKSPSILLSVFLRAPSMETHNGGASTYRFQPD